MSQILTFDDNLCVREPCLNYEECLSVLKFGNASSFFTTEAILFRAISPVATFACRCPRGFQGRWMFFILHFMHVRDFPRLYLKIACVYLCVCMCVVTIELVCVPYEFIRSYIFVWHVEIEFNEEGG